MRGIKRSGVLSCGAVRARLILHFYDAADETAALERHLAACPACAAIRADTGRCLRAVDAAAVFPREKDVDWTALARETAARARAAGASGARRPAHAPPVRVRRVVLWGGILAAAAAVVVLVGIRLGEAPSGIPVAGVRQAEMSAEGPEGARFLQQNVTRRAAARSLKDGRALLVDLMQAPVRCRRSDGSFDVALEKARSNDLLRRMSLYQGNLAGPGDRRLAELLTQIESVLLQISAMDDCTAAQAIHDMRDAIDRRQLLLRIDLVTREVEEGGARA